MSVAAIHDLTLREAARIVREAVRDKSYEATPLGTEVKQYLRALRWAGASPNTLNGYETVLSKLALRYADFDSIERFASPDGTELIREFLDDHWADASRATRRNRLSILKSFFGWAVDERHLAFSPAAGIKGPREPSYLRQAHSLAEIHLIVAAQERIEDEIAILLMGRLAFRKDDVRLFRVEDVDLVHDLLYIRRGKGQKPAELPIAFDEVRQALSLWLSAQLRNPHEYLLHPRGHRLRPMNQSTVHRWWGRCLDRAGVAHFPMHELRHSAADRLWRSTGNLILAQQLLRHESVRTTQLYLHPSGEDLRAGLLASDKAGD